MTPLYRDYTKLTKSEVTQVQKAEKDFSKDTMGLKTLLRIPKIFYFHNSFFPNNMLDVDELEDKIRITETISKFKSLIDTKGANERDILGFIKNETAYFIIASLLSNYDFGHHGAFIFPEFPLSTNHVVDYLLVGKNSGGHEFIFVELETINDNIVNANGSFGTSLRKGIQQIEDWDAWLEANYGNLRSVFGTYKNINKSLPEEFYVLDKSRIHYVVVGGRRSHYKESTYRKRRSKKNQNNIRVLHYDNLIDQSLHL
jgi:hypothetical protein